MSTHHLRTQRLCLAVVSALLVGGVLLVPGSSQARDAKSEARATIRQLQSEIGTLENRILAGDVLIVGARVALEEARKKDPPEPGLVFTLQISLGVLEAKKADLQSEKRAKERSLAEWEAYLRQLGG